MKPNALIEQIQQDRATFAKHWNGLSEAQMTQRPGVQRDWSVKDLIAHIIWWENHMLNTVIFRLSGIEGVRIEDYHLVNGYVFEQNKNRNLQDVLTEFESNMSKLSGQISLLSDEQLNKTLTHPTADYPLIHHISGNSFEHYKEHTDDLRNYVERL